MPAEDVVVGIDLGTSVVKSVAFDRSGRPVAFARRPNTFGIPHPGWAECDMEVVWKLVRETLCELVQDLSAGPHSVPALGVTGNMGGAWLTDGAKRPLRPAILWNDGRAAGVLTRWLRDLEPDSFAKARRLFFAKDWVRFKLTG